MKKSMNINYNFIFPKFIGDGIITFGDVMNSKEEEIMTTIIDTIHRYAISQTSDGRFTTYIEDATKPNGRRQIRRKSKSELYKFLLEFYGMNDNQKDMTFGELFEEWKNYKKHFINVSNKKKSLSPSTIARYERDYNRFFKDTPFETMSIHKITTPKLQMILADIIKSKQMIESCAKNVIGYVMNAFAFARRSEYIQKDPAEIIDKRLLLSMCVFTPPKSDSDRILTIDEMSELRKATLKHEEEYPLYMPDYAIELAMFTGMRVGEISALHWNDIGNDFIHIDFSEHRLDYEDKKSELIIGEPKNCKHRVVPITPDIRNLLNKMKALNIQNKDDFIFARPDGTRYSAHDISCAVERRASEASIKKTSIHGIRRTVSSQLNTVLPQKDVASMLGHSEQVNERHYNYSTAENSLKLQALSQVSSKVINISDLFRTKKIAGSL